MRRSLRKKLAAVFLSACLAASQSLLPIPAYARGLGADGTGLTGKTEEGDGKSVQNQAKDREPGKLIASDSSAPERDETGENAGQGQTQEPDEADHQDEPTQPEVSDHQTDPGVKEDQQQDETAKVQITGWEWVDPDGSLTDGVLALPGVNPDNQMDFETVVSLLPKKISVTVEGTATGSNAERKKELSVDGWNCEAFHQDKAGNWPTVGEYTFRAHITYGGGVYIL